MKRVVRDVRLGFHATVNDDGSPNLSPKGTTAVWDDDHLCFADIRSPQTVANIRRGPQVEVNVVDPFVRKGYRFRGPAVVHERGTDEFAAGIGRLRDEGFDTAEDRIQSIVVIEVQRALPLVSPAHDDGDSYRARDHPIVAATVRTSARDCEPRRRTVTGTLNDCVLCRLVRRELEVSIVHEDERSVTFMDIQPVVRGHMLVVPRAHAPYLADLDPEDGAQLFRVGQRAAAALRASTLRCEGVNLFLADGEAAGQEVFHAHLHVIPRYRDDGFGLRLPPDYSVRPRDELDEAAALLRDSWPSGDG